MAGVPDWAVSHEKYYRAVGAVGINGDIEAEYRRIGGLVKGETGVVEPVSEPETAPEPVAEAPKKESAAKKAVKKVVKAVKKATKKK